MEYGMQAHQGMHLELDPNKYELLDGLGGSDYQSFHERSVGLHDPTNHPDRYQQDWNVIAGLSGVGKTTFVGQDIGFFLEGLRRTRAVALKGMNDWEKRKYPFPVIYHFTLGVLIGIARGMDEKIGTQGEISRAEYQTIGQIGGEFRRLLTEYGKRPSRVYDDNVLVTATSNPSGNLVEVDRGGLVSVKKKIADNPQTTITILTTSPNQQQKNLETKEEVRGKSPENMADILERAKIDDERTGESLYNAYTKTGNLQTAKQQWIDLTRCVYRSVVPNLATLSEEVQKQSVAGFRKLILAQPDLFYGTDGMLERYYKQWLQALYNQESPQNARLFIGNPIPPDMVRHTYGLLLEKAQAVPTLVKIAETTQQRGLIYGLKGLNLWRAA